MSTRTNSVKAASAPEHPHRIYEVMAAEHLRLDGSLDLMQSRKRNANVETYQIFRETLLRHIRIEERILLQMAQERNDCKPLALAARLRLDHGDLAAMTMLPPTPKALAAVRTVLKVHNPLEDGPGGALRAMRRTCGHRPTRVSG